MANLSTSLKIDVSGFLNSIKQAVSGVKDLGANIPSFFKINADTKQAVDEVQKLNKEVKSVKDTAATTSGGLGALATGLLAGGGMALAQAGLSAVTGAISSVFDAALEADEIGDRMELAFRQAGLSGKELDAQLDSTTQFARKLGDQFAESPAEIKKLSTAAASLGGATGKANEDLTKLALGIQKASDGAISGESAIKILSKGVADPESAAALDKLTKKFPALGSALNSAGDTAGKVNASLLALAPTFATLEAQSTGIDAIAARFQNAGTEALQSFGGGIMGGLDKAGAAIAGAAGGLNFEGLYETAANIGEAIGSAVSTAVVYILDFYEKVKPIVSFIADVLIAQVRIQFGYFKAIIAGAFEIVGAVFNSLIEAVQPLIDVFSELFKSTGEGTDYVQELIDTIKEVVQVVVGVGKVIIEFLVTPIKLFVTEIVAVIGWIAKLISSFKSTTDSAKESADGVGKAKTGFERFREILQSIQLFLGGVSGAMKGLSGDVVNLVKALASFNLSKIKDAFLNLGGGAKQGFEDGWNQKKADLESDSVVKDFEKQIDELDDKSKELSAAQLAEQKKVLSDKVTAQKKANKISLDQEVDLQAAISKLGQSASKNKDLSKSPTDDPKAQKEKDLTEAIKKAKLENDKLLSDIEAKLQEDEKKREEKALSEKIENAVTAVKNEAGKVAELKNVSAKQREELIQVLNEREKIIIAQGEQDKLLLQGKFALKEFEANKKRNEDLSKANTERVKLQLDIASGDKTATGDGEIARLGEINTLKIQLIQENSRKEIAEILSKNAQVVEAETALKGALSSGNQERIELAKISYESIKQIALNTDLGIVASKQKTNTEIVNLEKENAESLQNLRILNIADSTERELQTKLAALKKQYDTDMELYRGNEQAKADLKREYDAKRYDAELEAANKSKDMATVALNSIRDLGLGIAENIRSAMGNTLDDLSKAFDTFAGDIKKKIADSGTDNSAKTEEEGKKLVASLKAHTISYQEFQAKSAELNKRRNAENVTSTEKANLAIGLSFQAMAKTAQAGINQSLVAMSTNAKAFAKQYEEAGKDKTQKDKALADGWENFKDNLSDTTTSMVSGMGAAFGMLAAQGKLTLENAGKAAAATVLDTVSSIVLANSVAIMSYAMASPLGPIAGAVVGAAGIALVTALLAAAKSSIMGKGYFSGGYTGDGSPHSVAGVVHGREVVFESGITAQNKPELLALRSMLQGGTRLKDIINNVTKSDSYVDATGKLQNISNVTNSNSYANTTNKLQNLGDVTKSSTYTDASRKIQNSPTNIFSDYRANKRLQTAEFAVASTGKNAQAMESANIHGELVEIRKLLAKPSRQKSVSAVDINIVPNPAFHAKQSAAAVRLERARK